MPFLGPCMTGQYPGALAARPVAAKAAYPGACKFVGYNAMAGKTAGAGFAAKGMCLGLGLGLGAWGPLLLIGAGLVGGYLLFKNDTEATPGPAVSEGSV